MRSRYSAFALGLGDYLIATLARDHEDRNVPALTFSSVKNRQRFLGLNILHAQHDEVLFFAKIFERGIDRSFMELSTFVREPDGWKYESGVLVPKERLPENPLMLDRESFLRL
jgi:SEC-C motif domain protein